jgi:hypothetical protein
MNKKSIICAILIFSFFSSRAQENPTVYQQLCKLNKEWLNLKPAFPVLNERTPLATDKELISMHLTLVEDLLRNKDISHLTADQKEKRNAGLDILHAYRIKDIFPINLYHADRTPYFIDHLGTACAVGHIVIETGFCDFATQIKNENNYGYIKELDKQYPQLKEWANTYGFTMDELALIQPTYGGGCSMGIQGMQMNPSCANACDGVIILGTPQGGTPPYAITGPGCSNLCAGTYTYTIFDQAGNTTVQIYTLIDPPAVTATATLVNDETTLGSCDGSLSASGTGGTGSFTYEWYICSSGVIGQVGPIASGLCTGSYSVLITDANGCADMSDCESITTAGCGMVSTFTVTNPSCYGLCDGSVTITTTGGTPPYLITDNMGGNYNSTGVVTINNLCAGQGPYLIEDSQGCTNTLIISVLNPPELIATATWVADATGPGLCNGQATGSFTGGTGAVTVNWIDCNTNISVGTGASINTLCAGDYAFVATDANGCSDTSACITMSDFTGINDRDDDFIFTFYPNPANEQLTLNLSGTNGNSLVAIKDLLGNVVLNPIAIGIEIEKSLTIDLSTLKSGFYFISVSNGERTRVEKIMVVR